MAIVYLRLYRDNTCGPGAEAVTTQEQYVDGVQEEGAVATESGGFGRFIYLFFFSNPRLIQFSFFFRGVRKGRNAPKRWPDEL